MIDNQSKKDAYLQLLVSKIKLAEKHGIKIDQSRLHTSSKPHQLEIVQWGLELGAALLAPDCGMGKSHMLIEIARIVYEEYGGKCLIVTELGATDTFINPDPEYGEGARLGVKIEYVTNQAEAFASDCWLVVTNYERVRQGNFDFSAFIIVELDEGNYIKNPASDTTNVLQHQLRKVKFKFIASATPNPNRTLELVNYAHVLGVCDRGQILTRFFQRNSVVAGDLTLHPQHEEDFWMWVYSWMVSIELPSDMGLPDEGYALPKLHIDWDCEVKLDKALEVKPDKKGQGRLHAESNGDSSERAMIRRESIDVRVRKTVEIIKAHPDDHFIIWHLLEDERYALEKALNEDDAINRSIESVYGTQDWTEREQVISAFMKGEVDILITKPELCGVGLNFQKHCHMNIFMSVDYDWDAFYQAVKRTHRFGQLCEVFAFVVWISEQYHMISSLKEKQRLQTEQRAKLRAIVQKFGLGQSKFIEAKKRSFFNEATCVNGENFTSVHGDSVLVYMDRAENSVDLINSSFPFGNHYEYTDLYNDFGHNEDLGAFREQMDFLIPELFRVLKPGRIAAVHLKNRIHYGSVTGLGFSVFHRFTHAICDSMEKHGFQTMGFHYIPTDVVLENNQTYRLGYGEMQKDSTKMGSGIPEEIWIFRKPPTSSAKAYADIRVTHNKVACPHCGNIDTAGEFERKKTFLKYCRGCKTFMHPEELIIPEGQYPYNLSNWQIDADSFWHSSGNRLPLPVELKRWGIDRIHAWWKKFNRNVRYDYEGHVELLNQLDEAGHLSREFTTLPMQSNTSFIWNDVNRMDGLNMQQAKRRQQNHICPQPFDEPERIIELYSNPGEMVDDCFGGLGTTAVLALKKRRKAFIVELSKNYHKWNVRYCQEEELKAKTLTLFDLQETA